jgi:hypothetical protein
MSNTEQNLLNEIRRLRHVCRLLERENAELQVRLASALDDFSQTASCSDMDDLQAAWEARS